MSDIKLTSDEALEESNKMSRLPSKNLLSLRKTLKNLLEGKKCLVLGSAPSVEVPDSSFFNRVLCVNGSPYIAKMNHLDVDLTVMTGYLTSMKVNTSIKSMDIIKGLYTSYLLFINYGDDEDNAKKVLNTKSFNYGSFFSISPIERSTIISEVVGENLGLGKRDERVSNGVFTIVLSFWAGAAIVIVSGFSLSGGHKYINEITPRYHVNGDKKCFQILSEKYNNLRTTSIEINSCFNIPLI